MTRVPLNPGLTVYAICTKKRTLIKKPMSVGRKSGMRQENGEKKDQKRDCERRDEILNEETRKRRRRKEQKM